MKRWSLMVKLVLLKSRISGRTFDDFRQQGFDIVDIVEVEKDVDAKGLLQKIIQSASIKSLSTKPVVSG